METVGTSARKRREYVLWQGQWGCSDSAYPLPAFWEDPDHEHEHGGEVLFHPLQRARSKICSLLSGIYDDYAFLLKEDCLTEREKASFCRKDVGMDDTNATLALNELSKYLYN